MPKIFDWLCFSIVICELYLLVLDMFLRVFFVLHVDVSRWGFCLRVRDRVGGPIEPKLLPFCTRAERYFQLEDRRFKNSVQGSFPNSTIFESSRLFVVTFLNKILSIKVCRNKIDINV